MRVLLDNALSPMIVSALREHGHDVVHVRDLGLQAAPDEVVLARALTESRILVSADTDFGTILALRSEAKPSFVLLRGAGSRRPDAQARAVQLALSLAALDLEKGAVVVVEADRIRVRPLPIVRN
ncbi:MAG: DUF5615 family PIN-like protein [Candidatus Eiseniibacteriota bacterium]